MLQNKSDKDLYNLSKAFLEKPYEESIEYIHSLSELLRFHEWKYYVANDPIIADYEYDQLYKKLETVESKHPEWIFPDSPSQRVSPDLTDEFRTVPHIVPMLSLDNSYNEEDLAKFDEQVKKLTLSDSNVKITYTVEPKFDGGSVAVIYDNDIMTRAATRGNGEKGEDITLNAKQINTLPLKAKFSSRGITKAELRGEAVIEKARFAEINLQRAKEEKTLYANPRNTATGGLRTKDPRETKERGTELFIFQLGYAENNKGENILNSLNGHYESIEFLNGLGFKLDQTIIRKCDGIKEVMQHCRLWERQRESYPYEIDGMVVKVNSYDLQDKCGSTGHHPRWAIAFKFKAKQATTTLENVEYQVGKIGSITPVAKVTPVALAGVTVSSISLHNEDFIVSKDLRIGDKVIIERAGDVIPYVVKSLSELRSGNEQKILFPTKCPSCETKLIREEGEAAWRCPNSANCPDQKLQRMYHHVSKDAMDIDGFGPSYIERFHDLGWLSSIADIYRLDYNAIAELEGFGSRSALKLEAAIEKAKSNPIHRFLYGMSIHHLGKKVSKLIGQRVAHVLDLQNWSEEDFINIPDIGPIVAKNVTEFFSHEENVATLKEMESLGVNLSQTEEDKPKEVSADAVFGDKTILFTGTLQKMGRKEAQALAEKHGAKNISAVSSNLDILVVGEKAGSKLKKAQALGTVEVLTEDEFINRIEV